jgi:hypothetical protein
VTANLGPLRAFPPIKPGLKAKGSLGCYYSCQIVTAFHVFKILSHPYAREVNIHNFFIISFVDFLIVKILDIRIFDRYGNLIRFWIDMKILDEDFG